MNENTKTALWTLVAAIVTIGVWFARPTPPSESSDGQIGQTLFPDFTDSLTAADLTIVSFDKTTGRAVPFQVAQVNQRWVIPSHSNYPTDAREQLERAATALLDLKVDNVASDNAAEHAMYGVLDPTDKDLEPGEQGTGLKVTVKNDKNKTLLSMIVGKSPKDAPAQRYVRRAGQDSVFVVKMDATNLSTQFKDWIEADLLQLVSYDIRDLVIEDYAIVPVSETEAGLDMRRRMTLQQNESGEPRWKLARDEDYDKKANKWASVALSADETLNIKKIEEMSQALGDLKIVDVVRKPEGLSADLAASKDLLENDAARLALAQRGFHVFEGKIYSDRGEVRCLMRDGVEYILRFGDIARSTAKAQKESEEADDTAVNRYLFVTTEFNPAALKKPKLEPLPELPKEAKDDAKKDDAAKANDKKQEDKKSDAKKADDKKPADKTAELKAKRDEIEKENKRRQDEYDDRVAQAKARVKELNARFADWYYVISEDVYQKIHLGRSDLIQKKVDKKGAKNAPPDPLAPGVFDQLKQATP